MADSSNESMSFESNENAFEFACQFLKEYDGTYIALIENIGLDLNKRTVVEFPRFGGQFSALSL